MQRARPMLVGPLLPTLSLQQDPHEQKQLIEQSMQPTLLDKPFDDLKNLMRQNTQLIQSILARPGNMLHKSYKELSNTLATMQQMSTDNTSIIMASLQEFIQFQKHHKNTLEKLAEEVITMSESSNVRLFERQHSAISTKIDTYRKFINRKIQKSNRKRKPDNIAIPTKPQENSVKKHRSRPSNTPARRKLNLPPVQNANVSSDAFTGASNAFTGASDQDASPPSTKRPSYVAPSATTLLNLSAQAIRLRPLVINPAPDVPDDSLPATPKLDDSPPATPEVTY